MKFNLINGAVLSLVLLMNGVPAEAGTVVLSGATGNTCSSYTNFSVDANGNLTISCNNPAPASPQVPKAGARTGNPPTAGSPLAEIKAWNYAFETLNHIPHDYKSEPIQHMNYFKVIQANKPHIIKLPTSW